MRTRREFLRAAGAGLAAPLLGADRKPNVIVILADDLGYADLGFQGAKDIPTPHLDKLAAGGVRFTNAYVSHPYCSPTRAGLMTGRYQQRFGHESNPSYDPRDEVQGLPTSETTIADVMASAGYKTGHVGKWHLGAHPKFHPMKRGFQESFGFLGGGHDYFKQQMEGEAREYFIPIQRDGQAVPESEYLTDALSREAAAFVKRHKSEPFFLYLAYNTPHTPLQPTQKYLDRVAAIADETRRRYAAMVCALDEGVGTVMAAVREARLESDTLVIFLSDNGGIPRTSNSSNGPLRETKGTVFEGGIRVPFVMHWVGTLKPGTYDQPAISLDILPTAAALAGAKLPPKLDGVDLMPYAMGKKKGAPHERLFWRTGGGVQLALREGRYKLVKRDGATALYDLEADLGEARDIAGEQPEIVQRLTAALERWNAQLVPPLFPDPRPAAKKKA